MVQCAHFAYDDEELPGGWGATGGCFPFDEGEEEEIEDDLLDPADLIDDPSIPEQLAGAEWERTPPREERESQSHWPTDSHHNKDPT